MKKKLPIIGTSVIMIVLLNASLVLMVKLIGFPINIPLINKSSLDVDYSYQNNLMAQWEDVRIYNVRERHETVEEIIESVEIEKKSEEDFYKLFPEINKETLDNYLKEQDWFTGSYEKILIDKVDYDNTPTGIKTKNGDDILAIDSFNNILIVGKKTNTGDIVKVTLLKNKKQLDMSVVDNLSYWSNINEHAIKSRAILAVNANSYNWHPAGNYGTTHGLIKLRGNLIRKQADDNQIVGFTQDGDIKVGTEAKVEDLYTATEFRRPLIRNSVIAEGLNGDDKLARTAIGQRKDGAIVIVNAAGGDVPEYSKGITEKELANILSSFEVDKASELSRGNKAIMFWNGRVVNSTFGYNTDGVKLPTSIIIKPSNLIE